MSGPYGPSQWRFARLQAPLSECSSKLQLLREGLKARSEIQSDPLFGLNCTKADHSTAVRFHRLDPLRAADSLIQVIQEFPVDDTPVLQKCCQVAHRHGYIRFVQWELPGFRGNWMSSLGETKAGSVTWEQFADDASAIDPTTWKQLWWQAGQSLGIADMLGEKTVTGFIAPEAIRKDGIGPLIDSRGFHVVVYVKPGRKISLGLDEVDASVVQATLAAGVTATAHVAGAPARQLVNLMYPGSDAEVTSGLNGVLPVCHYTSYILNDGARERIYRSMFKPLDIAPSAMLALPAIEVQRDEPTEITTVFAVNLVRTATDCWLEFQTTLEPEVFDWIEQTLGCPLDCWPGTAESRWGWYT